MGASCPYGSDCGDCGPRFFRPPLPPPPPSHVSLGTRSPPSTRSPQTHHPPPLPPPPPPPPPPLPPSPPPRASTSSPWPPQLERVVPQDSPFMDLAQPTQKLPGSPGAQFTSWEQTGSLFQSEQPPPPSPPPPTPGSHLAGGASATGLLGTVGSAMHTTLSLMADSVRHVSRLEPEQALAHVEPRGPLLSAMLYCHCSHH